MPSLLADLHDEILRVTGEAPELGPVTATHVDPRRVEAFAAIVRELYEGGDLDELKARFGELMEHTHGSEFAALAQELSDGDRGAAEIARLYERHALMFASPDGGEVVAPAGHPLHTCEAELHVLGRAGAALRTCLERLGPHPSSRTWETLEGTFVGALKRVCEVERHLRRIENLVLPLLAGRQGEGPAQLFESRARACATSSRRRAPRLGAGARRR